MRKSIVEMKTTIHFIFWRRVMNDGFRIASATLAVAGVGLGITPAAAQSTAGGSTSFWAHVQSFLPSSTDVAMTQVVSLFGPAVTTATGFEAAANHAVLGIPWGISWSGCSWCRSGWRCIWCWPGPRKAPIRARFWANAGMGCGCRCGRCWAGCCCYRCPPWGIGGDSCPVVLGAGDWQRLCQPSRVGGPRIHHHRRLRRQRFDPDRRTARQSVGPEHLQLVDLRETINRVESLPGGYSPLGVSTQDVAPEPGLWSRLQDLFSSTRARPNTTT